MQAQLEGLFVFQVPATGVPPPAMYSYPQQLGRPAPTTLMSHPPPSSGVVANPLPAAAMVQQQANTHHTLAHPLPQPTLPPTTSYIPTGFVVTIFFVASSTLSLHGSASN